MKILYLSHETGFSFGVYLEVISRAMAARGHEVHILNCSPFNPSRPRDACEAGVWIHRRRHLRPRGSTRLVSNPVVRPVVDRLRAPEVPAWTSPLTRLNAAATNYVEYRRLGFDADVVEAPEHLAEGLAFGVLRTRPLVVELHGPLGAVVPYWGFRPGWHLRVSDRIERLGARCATVTVAPSRFLADELAHAGWAGARHARVIPHAIDVATWQTVEPAGDTAPVVLAVGDVSDAKGADLLVDAAARLGTTVGDVELVFVGGAVTLPDGGSSVEAIAERERSEPASAAGSPATSPGTSCSTGTPEPGSSRWRAGSIPSRRPGSRPWPPAGRWCARPVPAWPRSPSRATSG